MTIINQKQRLFSSHFRQKIRVERQGESFTMTAIIHPLGAGEIQLLPESERYLPSVKVFTIEPLVRGDKVMHNGFSYVIKSVARWEDYGYYNSVAVRHTPTAKGDSKGFVVT